jgi:hypothetical protein
MIFKERVLSADFADERRLKKKREEFSRTEARRAQRRKIKKEFCPQICTDFLLHYFNVDIGLASKPISTVKFCNKMVISLISNR